MDGGTYLFTVAGELGLKVQLSQTGGRWQATTWGDSGFVACRYGRTAEDACTALADHLVEAAPVILRHSRR